MRHVLVTDAALAATIIARARLPGEALRIACPGRELATKLKRRGLDAVVGDPRRASTWTQLGIENDTIAVVALEDDARALAAVETVLGLEPDLPILVVDVNPREAETVASARMDDHRSVERVRLAEVLRTPFRQKFLNALVRRRVHQFRDHFDAADRVLILTHDEPDPDSLASALALRALLGRNRQTATIGTFRLPTRPENLRLIELLDIDVRALREQDLQDFERIAVVDTQPHIFGGKVPHVDLVIDHHPVRGGYTATFKDIRTAFGATTSMVLDYLVRCGIPISERLATAAVYAITTDTWSFRRGAVPEDVTIFAHVFPRADQAMLRRIEMEGLTLETMRVISRLLLRAELVGGFLHVHAGDVPRDDVVPTAADFLLHVAEARWTAVSGVLGDVLTISVRHLGATGSAGDLVQQIFGGLGSAGGHASAAKAVLPLAAVRRRFGDPHSPGFSRRLFRPLWKAAGEPQAPSAAD
jgi:nanoRNase/pAp phosphatase (c-di-AMP/oligoRNAs hydrolase)